MRRNDLIAAAERLGGSLLATEPKINFYEREKWALVGECERFGNDLCNAATGYNRRVGAVVYTVREGLDKLASLQRRAGQFYRSLNQIGRAA